MVDLLVDIFRTLLAKCDAIRSGVLEFHCITKALPVVGEHGAAYVRSAFMRRLASVPGLTLGGLQTSAWLKSAHAKNAVDDLTQQESASNQPLPQATVPKDIVSAAVRTGVLDLIFHLPPDQTQNSDADACDATAATITLPETLHLDADRLQYLHDHTQQLGIAACTLALVAQCTPQSVSCGKPCTDALKAAVLSHLKAGVMTIDDLGDALVKVVEEGSGQPLGKGNTAQFKAAFSAVVVTAVTGSGASPIASVIMKRVNHLLKALVVCCNDTAAEAVEPSFPVNCVFAELDEVARLVRQVVAVNTDEHLPLYSQIIGGTA